MQWRRRRRRTPCFARKKAVWNRVCSSSQRGNWRNGHTPPCASSHFVGGQHHSSEAMSQPGSPAPLEVCARAGCLVLLPVLPAGANDWHRKGNTRELVRTAGIVAASRNAPNQPHATRSSAHVTSPRRFGHTVRCRGAQEYARLAQRISPAATRNDNPDSRSKHAHIRTCCGWSGRSCQSDICAVLLSPMPKTALTRPDSPMMLPPSPPARLLSILVAENTPLRTTCCKSSTRCSPRHHR